MEGVRSELLPLYLFMLMLIAVCLLTVGLLPLSEVGAAVKAVGADPALGKSDRLDKILKGIEFQ